MRTVHIRADVRPFFQLGGAHVQIRTRIFRQGFAGVVQYPCGEGVGVPVVVDVVFVFVRAGYAVNHVFAVAFGEVDAVRPEAGHFDQDFQAFFGKIAFVAGVVGVVVDGVRNRAVAVDFLEGDFPFVVALDAGKRHHRIECARQALFARVVLRLRQLVAAVLQQVAGNFGFRQCEVERHGVGFGVPIGRAAVFFAGKAFGADVQARVFAVVGGEQLEQVEADALLRFVAAFDDHVGNFPTVQPACFVCVQQGFKRNACDFFRQGAAGGFHCFQALIIAAGSNNHAFFKGFGRAADFGFKRIGDLPVGLAAAEGFEAAGEGLLGVDDKLFHAEGIGDGLGGNVGAVV